MIDAVSSIPEALKAMSEAVKTVTETVNSLIFSPEDQQGSRLVTSAEHHCNRENAWWWFRQLQSKPSGADTPVVEPETANQMTAVVRAWLKDWFEHVQQTLYASTGIKHLVGALEAIGS